MMIATQQVDRSFMSSSLDKSNGSQVSNEKFRSPQIIKSNKKLTPCESVKYILRQTRPAEEKLKNLLDACSRKTTQKHTYDSVYQYVEQLLRKDAKSIFSLDANGYNVLHCVCSNSTLLQKVKLIELLVNISEKCIGNQSESKNSSLLLQETTIMSELPLHLACKNASVASLEIFEYLLKSQPDAVYFPDKVHLNLPLHNACIASTDSSVSLEVILLLVQYWPKSCEMQNKDGNLPLHLASEIMKPRICDNQRPDRKAYFDEDEIDTLEDIQFESTETEKDLTDDYDDDDECDPFPIPVVEYSTRVRRREVQELHQKEHNDFKKQLEIIQYLVEMYPEGLNIRNKRGVTPLQVALKSLNVPNKISGGKVRFTTMNHPIKLFLSQDPTTYNNTKATTSSDTRYENPIETRRPPPSFVIDASGHEFDEEKCSVTPWHETQSRRNSNQSGRRESASSGRADVSIRRGSVTDRRGSLISSSVFSASFRKAGRRGSTVGTTSRRSSVASQSDCYSTWNSSDPMLIVNALEDASDNYCGEMTKRLDSIIIEYPALPQQRLESRTSDFVMPPPKQLESRRSAPDFARRPPPPQLESMRLGIDRQNAFRILRGNEKNSSYINKSSLNETFHSVKNENEVVAKAMWKRYDNRSLSLSNLEC